MPKIERHRLALPIFIILWILFLFGYYSWYSSSFIDMLLIIIVSGPIFYLIYLVLSYKGSNSRLYGLKSLVDYLPSVKKPEGHVLFKTKFMWTVLCLILYFALTNIFIYGLDQAQTIDVFESFRAILAGASGSIVHLGIGPIVTASIIMQLFVGAKIVNLDLSKTEDKAVYQETQKLLVIIMILVEAVPQVYGYLQPANSVVIGLEGFAPGYGLLLANIIIIAQLFLGSYLVFLMDETISKWGIGSGISLFIAAGVSQAIITGTINWIPSAGSSVPPGTIPRTFYTLSHSSAGELYSGGLESIIFYPPNPIIALIGTISIFFIVAYIESTKIELPLSHERARGARGRYPIKLIYASNIPVILTSALLANISMWSLMFWTNPTLSQIPILGSNPWFGVYPTADQMAMWNINANTPVGGLAYYLNRPNGLVSWLFPMINPTAYESYFLGHAYWQHVSRVVLYFAFMVGMSIMFAKFWIETTNMGPKAVAEQIQRGGMQIPGFRRDPRVLEKVLNKYIPAVTVFSGAAVGALAAAADMIGTTGNTSGTGVPLTVGILIQFYEAMGREQLMEMHPLMRDFIGGT